MIEETIDKLRSGDRNTLARLITLAESIKVDNKKFIREILEKIIPITGKSIRLAITGAPGVGKSTFIESFGMLLTASKHKVAVLSIDPSSPNTKGSILGDKTRMEKLSKEPLAFIRPTASQSFPGGVAHATRECILLCEAAGFDIILVETVGVGQAEYSVKDMTDCFILLMLAGAGDELQGMKKGIMEMADIIVITKADGDNQKKAEQAKAEFQHALHLIVSSGGGWMPTVLSSSAVEGKGIPGCWELVQKFIHVKKSNGEFDRTRSKQNIAWLNDQLVSSLKKRLLDNYTYDQKWKLAVNNVEQNQWTVYKAVDYLLSNPTT